jgi:RNA polymerase primary sigma factor
VNAPLDVSPPIPAVDPRLAQLGGLGRQRWIELLRAPVPHGALHAALAAVARPRTASRAQLERWHRAAVADRPALVEPLAATLGRDDRLGQGFARARQQLEPAHGPALAAATAASTRYLALRNHLVEQHLGLVHLALARLPVAPPQRDDLGQDGVFGLVRALERFEPERGIRFSTYAMYWIRHEVAAGRSRSESAIRVPLHLETHRRRYARSLRVLDHGQPREQLREQARQRSALTPRQLRRLEALPVALPLPEPDRITTPLEPPDLDRRRLVGVLSAALGGLDGRERAILEHRFGLGDGPPQSLAAVAERLALSRERVRQLQERALTRLRTRLGLADDPVASPATRGT